MTADRVLSSGEVVLSGFPQPMIGNIFINDLLLIFVVLEFAHVPRLPILMPFACIFSCRSPSHSQIQTNVGKRADSFLSCFVRHFKRQESKNMNNTVHIWQIRNTVILIRISFLGYQAPPTSSSSYKFKKPPLSSKERSCHNKLSLLTKIYSHKNRTPKHKEPFSKLTQH